MQLKRLADSKKLVKVRGWAGSIAGVHTLPPDQVKASYKLGDDLKTAAPKKKVCRRCGLQPMVLQSFKCTGCPQEGRQVCRR